MIAACYSMDLYCRYVERHGNEFNHIFPHQFTGETFGECKRQAQQRGWVFNNDDEVTCPHCSGKKPTPTPVFPIK